MKRNSIQLLSGVAAIAFACLLQSCSDKGGKGDRTDSSAVNATPATPTDNDIIENYRGIDVSRYNGNLVAEIDASDSLTFIVCKASEGINYRDPDYDKNRETIKQKGVLSGNYHFYHTADDPATQANFFWSTIQAAGKPDMPPIVDIEQGSLPQPAKGKPASSIKVDIQKLQKDLLTFVQQIEKLSGRVPIIYTGEAFANQYLTNEIFAKYPLWLAEYSGKPRPVIPVTWKTTGIKIWQKTDKYNIDSKPTDYDLYVGKKSDLLK